MVVAQRILIREERLSGILRSRQAELEAVAVVELIAQVVPIAVAGIAVLVALALIHRYPDCSHEAMTALLEHGG